MKEINIAKTLVNKRHEKEITQDELAEYIGVSKASVSKWETGQSYPDITFLPQLASYFNISIDELMDYSPQMTKEDIRKLYHRLATDFATKPFDVTMDECKAIIKKYYACFPLLIQMVTLLFNHHMLAGTQERSNEIVREISKLCERIEIESDDVWISKNATNFRALCLLVLHEPQSALNLLGETIRQDVSERPLIAQAYQQLGNTDKAKEVVQIDMYLNLLALFNAGLNYLTLCIGEFTKAEETYNRLMGMSEIYRIEGIFPNSTVLLYAFGANMYCIAGNKEKAVEMLNKYADFCVNRFFPITLHGDSYFDKMGAWLEELALGTAAPRDEKVIKESMLNDVLMNPSFESLADEAGYKSAVQKLKNFIGGN